MKIALICTIIISLTHSGSSSLMSRIGLTLGKVPAHLNTFDHTRRIPPQIKAILDEEKRHADTLPFIKKAEPKRDGPPPCIGICYTMKLEALKQREELTKHNEVLKEDCESDDCIDYKAFSDAIPVQFSSKPSVKHSIPPVRKQPHHEEEIQEVAATDTIDRDLEDQEEEEIKDRDISAEEARGEIPRVDIKKVDDNTNLDIHAPIEEHKIEAEHVDRNKKIVKFNENRESTAETNQQ